ncbi:LYR motif-containing protein 4 [Exaiptasia diaphana]|nr:LYR motif-containing protein 4 [Exaiptasia diaphana]
MATVRSKVLNLYRQVLREGLKFSSYNYREYAIRKAKDEFRAHKNITDSEHIKQLIQQAEQNLHIIRRQTLLNNMYRHEKLVIEKQ